MYSINLAGTEKSLNKFKISVHRTEDGMDLGDEREYRNRFVAYGACYIKWKLQRKNKCSRMVGCSLTGRVRSAPRSPRGDIAGHGNIHEC